MIAIIILVVVALIVLLLGFLDIKIPFMSERRYLKKKENKVNKKSSLSQEKITKDLKETLFSKTTLPKQRMDEHSFFKDGSSNHF